MTSLKNKRLASVRIKQNKLAGFAFGGLLLAALPARAEGFDLIEPQGAARLGRDPIVLSLPQNLASAELNQFYLELDEVDITQLVSLSDNRVIYAPQDSLAAGRHKLRLVRAAPNDKIVEIGIWTVIVSGAAEAEQGPVQNTPVQSTYGADIEAVYSYLVADNLHGDSAIDPHNLAASGFVEGQRKAPGLALSGKGNFNYDSENANQIDGDRLALGEYLVTAENSGGQMSETFKFGNHDAGIGTLLVDDFYRRGFSVKTDFGAGRAAVTGFAQDPTVQTGNRNVSGVMESKDRAQGINVSLAPFAALMDRFLLDATLYQGQRDDDIADGTGGASDSPNEGHGYGFGIEGKTPGNRVKIRTEYAHSVFDADKTGPLAAEGGDAYKITATYLPTKDQTTADGHFKRWGVDATFERIGTFFQSLANASLPGDVSRLDLGSHYIEGGFNLDGSAWFATNNVDNDPALTDDQDMGASAQLAWSPETVDGLSFLGTPTFMLGAGVSDQARVDTPVGYLGSDLGQRTVTANAGLTASREKLTWTLTHTYTHFEDRAYAPNGYVSHFDDLSVDYQAHERLLLRPGVQAEYLDQRQDGASMAWFLNLGVEAVLIPGKLRNVSSASFLLNDGNTQDNDRHTAESEFTWQFRDADNFSPGLAVSLDGQYDHAALSSAAGSDDEYKIFARLKLSAPFRR